MIKFIKQERKPWCGYLNEILLPLSTLCLTTRVKYLLKKDAAGRVKAAAVWRPEQRSCREGAATSADIQSHQNPHLGVVKYLLVSNPTEVVGHNVWGNHPAG